MDIRRLIEIQIKAEQRLKKDYTSKLKKLPTGRLTGFRQNGRVYYKWIDGGKEKYIGGGNPELVEKLRNSDSFRPDPSKEDKSFFDRLRNIF